MRVNTSYMYRQDVFRKIDVISVKPVVFSFF